MERFNLGNHTRAITTTSADAQRLFNLGLNWTFGFNQEEGVACFNKAIEYDAQCAMAYWGVAYAAGPFYNFTWNQMSRDEANRAARICFDHVKRAQALILNSAGVESALIGALSERFPQPHAVSPEEFNRWDDAYASAMRKVYRDHPGDTDVAALFIEALMVRTAWKLWNRHNDEPAPGANTLEALDVCNDTIALLKSRGEKHPAIYHLHIHLTEMSSHPELALESAKSLEDLCPDAGHMNHMPGHTYVLCGQYDAARRVSEKAIQADDLYVDYAGVHNFYTTARCHDLHLMMHACMFLGQCETAKSAADKLAATLTSDVINVPDRPFMSMTLEGYHSMTSHVLVRFGRWQDIIEQSMPTPESVYPVSTAMMHYAKAIAFATLKQFPEAIAHQAQFYAALKQINEDYGFFNNSAHSVLGIARTMMDGEIAYHQGNHREAFQALRESVERNDQLEYSEPWAWMHPPRHALGALLLEQGHYQEAEDVYRTDLGLNEKTHRSLHHPNNIWALHGLVECLRARDDTVDLPEFENALAVASLKTDIAITSSCLCRTTITTDCCTD